jgi:hypothetical protein
MAMTATTATVAFVVSAFRRATGARAARPAVAATAFGQASFDHDFAGEERLRAVHDFARLRRSATAHRFAIVMTRMFIAAATSGDSQADTEQQRGEKVSGRHGSFDGGRKRKLHQSRRRSERRPASLAQAQDQL